MGQDFLIANDGLEQFLDPLELPSSSSFPNLMSSEFISSSIMWLSCGFDENKWKGLRGNFYTSKYLGIWSGTVYKVYGDYEHEEHSRFIRRNYENISVEVVAMLLEMKTSVADQIENFNEYDYKRIFAKVALLDHAPSNIVNLYKKEYGKDWKAFASQHAYYRRT